MIFAIQRFLEDHFATAAYVDRDQYAISLANLYDRSRAGASGPEFLRLMRRIRTAFFKANRLDRDDIEAHLLTLLDRRFKKKIEADPEPALMPLASGLVVERQAFRRAKRRTIRLLLERFRHAIESVADDLFWDSRRAHRLKMKPESIAQAALALTVKALVEGPIDVLREFKVGTGYVDVGILLSKLHIVELKILKSGHLIGPEQLGEYLRLRGQKKGWLVIIDARRPGKKKTLIPNTIQLTGGRIAHVVTIDINPVAPSRIAA